MKLLFHGATASSEPGPPHYRGFTIAFRHTTLGMTSPNNTQYSQQTDIHAPGGIRTRNPTKRAVADLRGHRDRVHIKYLTKYSWTGEQYN